MVSCSKCNAEETETYAHAKCDECNVLLCVNCSNLSASEHKGITLKKRSPCVRYSCCECLKSMKDENRGKIRRSIGDIETSLLKAMQKGFDDIRADFSKTDKVLKYIDAMNRTINSIKSENGIIKATVQDLTSKILMIDEYIQKQKPEQQLLPNDSQTNLSSTKKDMQNSTKSRKLSTCDRG